MGSAPAPAGPSLYRHSIESSVAVTAGLLVLAIALPRTVPLWWVIMGGAALTVAMLYASLLTSGSVEIGIYLTAWGIVATGWLAAARIFGPWHAPVLAGLFIPAVILAPLGAVAIGYHRSALDRERLARDEASNVRELRKWQKLLVRLGVEGVTVLDIVEHGQGRQIHGRLGKITADGPRPGTIATLREAAPMIAQHRRLPAGAVTIEQPPGTSSAEFVLHIREESGPRETVYLPAENNLLTINRPLGLALRDDGREWTLRVREVNVLIAGVTGSGKSNLLQVFIAQLARCVDVVVFMIDLKGGRAARPWMVPWIQGFTPRPVIDWLATTREEAALMLQALWAAREARSRSGAGGEKILPSADLPAILLLCDEAAVLFGHQARDGGISSHAVARDAARLAETGRAEAINLITAAVRADVETFGNTVFKAMSRVRIGLGFAQESDGRSVFPDDTAAARALAQITEPGSGLAKVLREITPPLHFYRITDGNPDEEGKPTKDRITPVALFAGGIRPQLDELTMEAMGPAYAERWTREHGQELRRGWGAAAGVKPPPDPDSEFGKIVAQLDDPESAIDPRRARMRAILIERKWQGSTVGRLFTRLANEGLNTPKGTLQHWLAADEKMGMVRRTGPPHNRWVWVFSDGADVMEYG